VPNKATAEPNRLRIITHSNSEPSWLPQTPEILYSSGFAVCEFWNTLRTEKSDVT